MAFVDDIIKNLSGTEDIWRARREQDANFEEDAWFIDKVKDTAKWFVEETKVRGQEARAKLDAPDTWFFKDAWTIIGLWANVVWDALDEFVVDPIGRGWEKLTDFWTSILNDPDAWKLIKTVWGWGALIAGWIGEWLSNSVNIIRWWLEEVWGLWWLYDAAVDPNETVLWAIRQWQIASVDKALWEDADLYTDNEKLLMEWIGSLDILWAWALAKWIWKGIVKTWAKIIWKEIAEESLETWVKAIAKTAAKTTDEVAPVAAKQVSTDVASDTIKAWNTGTQTLLKNSDDILEKGTEVWESLFSWVINAWSKVKDIATSTVNSTSVGKVLEWVSNAYTYLDPIARTWFKAFDAVGNFAKAWATLAWWWRVTNSIIDVATNAWKFGSQFVTSPGARWAWVQGIIDNYNQSDTQKQRAYERVNDALWTNASFWDYTAFKEQVSRAYDNFQKPQSATSKNQNKSILANLINDFSSANGWSKKITNLKDLEDISNTIAWYSQIQKNLIKWATSYDYLTRRNVFQNLNPLGNPYALTFRNGEERLFDQWLQSFADKFSWVTRDDIDTLYNADKSSDEYIEARERVLSSVKWEAYDLFEEQQPIGTNPTLRAQIRETIDWQANAYVEELERQLWIDADEKVEGSEIGLLYLSDELKEQYNELGSKGNATTLLDYFGSQLWRIDEDIDFLEEKWDTEALLAAETNKLAKEKLTEVMYARLEYLINNDWKIWDVDEIGKDVVDRFITDVKFETQKWLWDGLINDVGAVRTQEILNPLWDLVRWWADDLWLYSTNRLSLENKWYAWSLLADTLDNFEGLWIMLVWSALNKAFNFRTKNARNNVKAWTGKARWAAEWLAKLASWWFEELFTEVWISGISAQPISSSDYAKVFLLGVMIDGTNAVSQNAYYRSRDILDNDWRFIQGTINKLKSWSHTWAVMKQLSPEEQVNLVRSWSAQMNDLKKNQPEVLNELVKAWNIFQQLQTDALAFTGKQKTDFQTAIQTGNSNNMFTAESAQKIAAVTSSTWQVDYARLKASDIQYTPEYRNELNTFIATRKNNAVEFVNQLNQWVDFKWTLFTIKQDGWEKLITIGDDGQFNNKIWDLIPDTVDRTDLKQVQDAIFNSPAPESVKKKINTELALKAWDLDSVRQFAGSALVLDWAKAANVSLKWIFWGSKADRIKSILDRNLGTAFDDADLVAESFAQQARESYPILNQRLQEGKATVDWDNNPNPFIDLSELSDIWDAIEDWNLVTDEDWAVRQIRIAEWPFIIDTTIPYVLREQRLTEILLWQGKSELQIRKYLANLAQINELIYYYNHSLNLERQWDVFYNTHEPSTKYAERLRKTYGLNASEFMYEVYRETTGEVKNNANWFVVFKITGNEEQDAILSSLINRSNYSSTLSESGVESLTALKERYLTYIQSQGQETDVYREKFKDFEGIPPYRSWTIGTVQDLFLETLLSWHPDQEVIKAAYVAEPMVNIANALFDGVLPKDWNTADRQRYMKDEPKRVDFSLKLLQEIIKTWSIPTINILGHRHLSRDKDIVEAQRAVKRAYLWFNFQSSISTDKILAMDVEKLNLFDEYKMPYKSKDSNEYTEEFKAIQPFLQNFIFDSWVEDNTFRLYNKRQQWVTRSWHIQKHSWLALKGTEDINIDGLTLLSYDEMQLRYRNHRQEWFGSQQEELALYADLKEVIEAQRAIARGDEVTWTIADPKYIIARLATLDFGENATELVYFTWVTRKQKSSFAKWGRYGWPAFAVLARHSPKFRNEYTTLTEQQKKAKYKDITAQIEKSALNQNYAWVAEPLVVEYMDSTFPATNNLNEEEWAALFFDKIRRWFNVEPLRFNFKQGNLNNINREVYSAIFKKLWLSNAWNMTTAAIRKAFVEKFKDTKKANEFLNDAISNAVENYSLEADRLFLGVLESTAKWEDRKEIKKQKDLNKKIYKLTQDIQSSENKSTTNKLKKDRSELKKEYNKSKREQTKVKANIVKAVDALEKFEFENFLFHDWAKNNNMSKITAKNPLREGYVPVYALDKNSSLWGNMDLQYKVVKWQKIIYAPWVLFDRPYSKLSDSLISEFYTNNPQPLDIRVVPVTAQILASRNEGKYKLIWWSIMEATEMKSRLQRNKYNWDVRPFVAQLIPDTNVAATISTVIPSYNQEKWAIISWINDVIDSPGVRDSIVNRANTRKAIEAQKKKVEAVGRWFTADLEWDVLWIDEAIDLLATELSNSSKVATPYIDATAELIQQSADNEAEKATLINAIWRLDFDTAEELILRDPDLELQNTDTVNLIADQELMRLMGASVDRNVKVDKSNFDKAIWRLFSRTLGEIMDASPAMRSLQNWYAGRLSTEITIDWETKNVNLRAKTLNQLIYQGSKLNDKNRKSFDVDQKLKDIETELKQSWADGILPTSKEANILLRIVQHFQSGIDENTPTEIRILLEQIPAQLFNDSEKVWLIHDRITWLIASTDWQGNVFQTLWQLSPGYYAKLFINGKTDINISNTRNTEELTKSNDKFKAIFWNELDNDDINFLIWRLWYWPDMVESDVVSALTNYGPIRAWLTLAGKQFINSIIPAALFWYNGQTKFKPKDLIKSRARSSAYLKMFISYGLAPFNAWVALLAQTRSVFLQYQWYRWDVMNILDERELAYVRQQTNLGNDLADIAAQLSQGVQNLALDVLVRWPILDILADNFFMEKWVTLEEIIWADGDIRSDMRAELTDYMRTRFRQVFGATVDGKLNSRQAWWLRTTFNPLGTWAANQSRTFINNVAWAGKRLYVNAIENWDFNWARSWLYNNIENTRFISSTLRSLAYARRLCELERAVTDQWFGYEWENFERSFGIATCGLELLNQFDSPINLLAWEWFQSSPMLRTWYAMYKAMMTDYGGETEPKLLLGFTAFYDAFRKAMVNNTWITDSLVTWLSQAYIDKDVSRVYQVLKNDLAYKQIAVSRYLASDQEQDINSGRPVERGIRRVFLGSDYFSDLKYELKPFADAKAIKATDRWVQYYLAQDMPIVFPILSLLRWWDADPFLDYNDPQELYDFMVSENRVWYQELVNGQVPEQATDQEYRYLFRLMRYFGPGRTSKTNQTQTDFSDTWEREIFYTQQNTVELANSYLKESMWESEYNAFIEKNLDIDRDSPWDWLKSDVYTDALAKFDAGTPWAWIAMLGSLMSVYEDQRAKALGFWSSSDPDYYNNNELQNRVQSELGKTFGKYIYDVEPWVWADFTQYSIAQRAEEIVRDPTVSPEIAEDLSRYAKDIDVDEDSIWDSSRLQSWAVRRMIFFDVTADKYAETWDIWFIEGMNSTLRTIPNIKSIDPRRFPTNTTSKERDTLNERAYLERRIEWIEWIISNESLSESDKTQFNNELKDYKVQQLELKPTYEKLSAKLDKEKEDLTDEQKELRTELNKKYYEQNEAFHIWAVVHTHQELIQRWVPEQRVDKYVLGILAKSWAMMAAWLANPDIRELLGDTADYAAKIIFETWENAWWAEAAKNDLERAVWQLQNGYWGWRWGSGRRRSSWGQYRGIWRHSSKFSDTPLEDYKAIKIWLPKVKALTKSLLKTYKPTKPVKYKRFKSFYDADQFKRLFNRARYESLISDKIVTSELTKQKPKFKVKIKNPSASKKNRIETPDPIAWFEAPEFEAGFEDLV